MLNKMRRDNENYQNSERESERSLTRAKYAELDAEIEFVLLSRSGFVPYRICRFGFQYYRKIPPAYYNIILQIFELLFCNRRMNTSSF